MFENLLHIARPRAGWAAFRTYVAPWAVLEGLGIALLLSLFIYLEYWGIRADRLVAAAESLAALTGFYLLLRLSRQALFWAGFFIGLLWFYWIAFSFRYYDVSWLMPLMILFVALSYGFFFWVIGLFSHPLPRAVLIWAFSYFHPLSFNWFIPELSLIHTPFGTDKLHFALLLAALVLFLRVPGRGRWLGIVPLIVAAVPFGAQPMPQAETKIMLADPKTDQAKKWEEAYLPETIENNLATILQAISEGYEMVVLPESVFPLFLNADMDLTHKLQELSKEIVIVAGALYSDGKNAYNSTYYFDHGKIYIANKVILVPFGESIPLPRFLARWINDLFYDGAEDYQTAKRPVDLKLSTGTFRNAICYEATRDELFAGNPRQMIAISNNAWFTPSIEPTLQKLLLTYFARKYGTIIYHSANMGISTTIR